MKFIFSIVSIMMFSFLASTTMLAQDNANPFIYGDALPDAPALAARGEYQIGVQTLKFINKDQVDVLNSKDGIDPLYDRPITVEVWYPAALAEGTNPLVTYEDVLGSANNPKRPLIPFTFQGRAARDAKPLAVDEPFPLVIVSHGYVGSRFLLTYLTENIASKGYIVVAIDHTESTYRDAGPFQSTLLNRSKDALFVMDEVGKLGKTADDHFLAGLVDGDNTAIIGYSMGGYGALNAAGAGYSDAAVKFFTGMTKGSNALAVRGSNHPDYQASIDPRIKAVVAFAPWGMVSNVWYLEGLKLESAYFFCGR